MNKNILIVGVGGQGTLLASKIMGNVILAEGLDVKVSEIHGMSQRGGSVSTYVKYGKKVESPVIDMGEADLIISFEQLESARWLPYLKEGGTVITGTQKIDPMPVITGAAVYPDNIIEKIKEKNINIIDLPADELAENAGNIRSVNLVLLGAASNFMDFETDKWIEVIKTTVPPKTVEVNLTAFTSGKNY